MYVFILVVDNTQEDDGEEAPRPSCVEGGYHAEISSGSQVETEEKRGLKGFPGLNERLLTGIATPFVFLPFSFLA